MIRFLLFLLVLGYIAQYHPDVRAQFVPVAVDGRDLQQPRAGLVALNGHVLDTGLSKMGGGLVVKLGAVDGEQITVYYEPGKRLKPPVLGSYVQVIGKSLGPGALTGDQLKTLKSPWAEGLPFDNLPVQTGQRARIRVTSFHVQPLRGDRYYAVVNGKQTVWWSAIYPPPPAGSVTEIWGVGEAGYRFHMEGYR